MSLTRRAVHGSVAASVQAVSMWQLASRTAACYSCRRAFASRPARGNRQFEEQPDNFQSWAQTPPRMEAPFPLRLKKNKHIMGREINSDPEVLDLMYEKLLGPDVAGSLPAELKWLAVTHKSFDNGRRGFNTRLAFYGRMILALEATKAVMAMPASNQAVHDALSKANSSDRYGRTPFTNPTLDQVDRLDSLRPHMIVHPKKMLRLADEVGLTEAVRWTPRLKNNLEASGNATVMATALLAILGAVSMQCGADVANQAARNRILPRLGLWE